MPVDNYLTIITQLGIVPAIAAFLLYHQQKQYNKLAERLSRVEDHVRDKLYNALNANAALLERATLVLDKQRQCSFHTKNKGVKNELDCQSSWHEDR